MPDKDGKLTESEKKKALEWFKAHWPEEYRCPVSGHTDWLLAEHMVVPPRYAPGTLGAGGISYPQVMVICQGCGLTLYFNATLMGVLEKPQPPPEPPKDAKSAS